MEKCSECRICRGKSQDSQATHRSDSQLASKGPICPDIENEDLSSISSTYRADFINPESQALLSNGGR